MKKIIYLIAATLVFSIQGVTIAAELTENIDDGDLNKLEEELCHNSIVTQILANNELEEQYVAPATGGGDDDDNPVSATPVQPISAQEVLLTFCS